MYEFDENGRNVSGAKVASTDAVYRDAFPAYRVFIYYHEVTNDVVEVRTNNSGGSAERTASSASITLLNPFDKYVISTLDIVNIGSEEAKINNRSNEIAFNSVAEMQGQYAQLRDEVTTLAAAGNIDGLKSYLTSSGLNVEDFITTTYAGIEIINKESMIASIMEAGNTAVAKSTLAFDPLGNDKSNAVKYSVLNRKLRESTNIIFDKNTDLVRYKSNRSFNYPYQQGDCVFHPNDAVRIAFRDPFDARIWYWRFSGFMDTWTDTGGVNKDSTITVNCTDVTKMARYTYAQINTGILDDIILPDGSIDTNKGPNTVLFYKELFAGFQVYEILEILFFGATSLEAVIDADTKSFIAGLSDDEATAYLLQNYNAIKEDVDLQNAIFNTEDIHNADLQHSIRDAIFSIRQSEVSGRLPNLKNIGVVSHPSGTTFKRKSAERGVSINIYGEMDEYERQIGSEQIKDLKQWNETIHHRVRLTDLDTMSVDGSSSDKFSQVTQWDMDKIISIIGTNEQGLYPVGCGNVFYLTSSGLTKRLGNNAIDRSFGGPSSMHSEFIDDLSFLYDLAENIEYCFYATPKGDVIFEMPFYDFDVEDFVEQSDITDNNFGVADVTLLAYEELFREAYSGTYTDAELSEMTSLVFDITESGTNYRVNDYSNVPTFNYYEHFTIEGYEQFGYSNSNSDVGVATVARSSPMLVEGISSLNTLERKHAMVMLPELIPMLGVRILSGGMLGFITDYSIAQNYLGILLNKVNAEARNLSVSTVPKFGLMVNRPLRWRTRSYSANVVSLSDSIIWNSSCDTSVNLNQIRGWSGGIDSQTGKPVMKHFGGDRPFDLAKLLKGDDEDKE